MGYFRSPKALMGAVVLSLFSFPLSAGAVSCHGGNATICGVVIPMPNIASPGDRVVVPIPASVLGDSYAANPNLSFTVQCVDDGNGTNGNGGASFHILDADHISCAPFPCQTSTVRICDTSISVPGGTPLGGVVHMTMPMPYVKNNFTVQCVGSEGNPPVYQITDRSSVICQTPVVAPQPAP